MDYKKIIKSRATRLAILRILSFVPDKWMLKLQYRIKLGKKLNLKDPKRYTEKLQWYKLYHKDPLMIQCVDKCDVRNYVQSKGLEHILNVCYGVYDRPDDIDFDALPNQFVLKDTLGGGGNAVLLIKDKAAMNEKAVRLQLQEWVNENHRARGGGREWPYYSGKKHRIIAERYIEADANAGGLIDYKFFCFHGKVEYIYGVADRELGEGAGFGIFDRNFNLLPYGRADERPLMRVLKKPDHFEMMIEYAQRIAEPFPHARVDFYDQGEIVFGEITFFDGSGYMRFDPDAFDFMMGEKFTPLP